MLNDIVKQLEIICNYKINPVAAKNVLQARMCSVFSFNNITFTSYANLKHPKPISYYAFNFVPSGGIKNLLLDEINSNLFPFFDDVVKKFNDDRMQKLDDEFMMKMANSIESDKQKKEEEQELKLKKRQFQKINADVTSATQAKMYEMIKIIKEENKGSLCLKNTEFLNYFSEAFIGRNSLNKEFLNMLFNLWDGEFDSTNTVQTDRENIKGISFSAVLMADPRLIFDGNKLMSHFLNYLSCGMARRSFIYFKNKENMYKKTFKTPTAKEKMEAYNQLEKHGNTLKSIFDILQGGKHYTFSEEANDRIIQHNEWVFNEVAEFYKVNDYLDEKTEILKLNIEHSTWKIIKLAVLYHIMRKPSIDYIEIEDFNKALEFFKETHQSLKSMLFADTMGDVDMLFNYMLRNINKWNNKTTLRKQKFVSDNYFKQWLEQESIYTIADMAKAKKLGFADRVTGANNSGREIALYDPKEYKYDYKNENGVIKGELKPLHVKIQEVAQIG